MVNLKRFATSILATLIIGQLVPTPTAFAALTGTTVSMVWDQTTTSFDPSIGQQATIKYRVGGPDVAQLTLKVFKQARDGTRICKETDSTLLVSTLVNGSKPVGENTSLWSGKKADGVTNEAPGAYCFVLRWTNPLVNSTNPTVQIPSLDKAFYEGTITVNNPGNPGTTPPPSDPAPVNPATAITIDSSSTTTLDLSAASATAKIRYKINTDLPNGYSMHVYNSAGLLISDVYNPAIQRVSATPAGSLLELTWNGTYTNGVNQVDPGNYTVRFKIGGLFGATWPVTVTRSTTPPSQNQFTIYANPSSFNPSVSGTTIYYNVYSTATNGLTIVIRDSSNNTITQLYSTNQLVPVGSYSIPWNGVSNNSGSPVRYRYALISNGQEIGGDVWVLSNTTTPPASTFVVSHSLNRTSFTPANGEKVTVTYTLGKAVYNFKLTIKDPTGTLSYVLDSASYRAAGTYTSPEWAGIISQVSNPAAAFSAAAGTYNYFFEATGETPVTGVNPITLLSPTQQTGVPVITDIGPTPTVFNPDNIAVGGSGTTFTYLISQDARVDFKILNGNTTVKQLRRSDSSNNGFANVPNTVTWDGRDEYGSTVANGTYTYSISAVNSNGVALTKTGFITVDRGIISNNQIDVRNVQTDPSTFNPYVQSQMTIRFTLNREAYVRVTITRASDSSIVKILPVNQYSQFYSSGSNSVTWNGTDLNNYLVTTDGTYYVRVEASSASYGGNSNNTDTETATFTLNRNYNGYNNGQLQVTANGADPITFNPNNNENTKINFNVNMAPSTMNVKIYRASDGYNNVIREVPVLTLSGYYSYLAQWDGRDNYGRVVNDDTYTFRIEVTSAGNSYVAYASGTIYVNSYGNTPYAGNCGNYSDVKSNHYMCPALEFVRSHNIFSGYTSDGSIRLNRVITRAELLAVIQKAFKFNLESYNKNIDGNLGFKDLSRKMNEWYMPYIKTFSDLGLIAGYPDKTMKPDRTMTTAELYLVFLKAALNAPQNIAKFELDDTVTEKPFTDTPLTKATRWYIKYAAFAALNDLVVTERFYPDRGITRGQVIELIYNTYKKGLIIY